MSDPLAQMREKFVARCREDLQRLRQGEGAQDLRQTIHRLAGAGGVFGYPELSELARRLDDQAHDGEPYAPADVRALIVALEAATA